MSLTKKDPSLRVAANDPHLVSLGGGRLSTAVTIHNIPIGDTTIGASSSCNISLNGLGIQPVHCTIYRSETNEVTIVPEQNARVLLDGQRISTDTSLTQGAMLTIGNYNLLRFNNPAEAQMMRSALGSDTDNTQMDFTAQQRNSGRSLDSHGSSTNMTQAELRQSLEIESFYETNIDPMYNGLSELGKPTNGEKTLKHLPPIDINGLQCPKVFTADLVTVNMPAKDVLGQKYASFAKNLAENHRAEKQVNNNSLRNNQQVSNNMKPNITGIGSQPGNYVNIPSTSNYIQNTAKTIANNTEYLTKVNNTTSLRAANNINNHNAVAYDRYPKPGTYGGLQIYPMNGINTEINNGSGSAHNSPLKSHEQSPLFAHKRQLQQLSNTENERLEDMLKICTEYADRQNQSTNSNSNSNSITSSPIVQNRIKTNGSLPREKKSPFHHEHTNGQTLQQSQQNSGSNSNLASAKHVPNAVSAGYSSTGYENVRLLGQNRVEINGQLTGTATATSVANNASSAGTSTHHATGYENVVVGKYVPQSPRTKIRTTCMSPKKEHSFSNAFTQALKSPQPQPPPIPNPKPQTKPNEYEQLIKTFEEKLRLEMQAIEESSRYQAPQKAQLLPPKRLHKNINNLTLQIQQPHSLQNSPKLSKKPAPAPRTLNRNGSGSCGSLQHIADNKPTIECQDVEQLKTKRKALRAAIQRLKEEISELRKQEDEVLRELDMEKALVTAEMSSVGDSVEEYESQLSSLQNKIHRLEAQRNATRVMEENQQAKLKQSIEMKQDQIKKLKAMLKQKPNNECLKEEIHNVSDSLENERKAFEDLEFQYLEEESEWHAYREELHAEEKTLQLKIEEKRLELQHLEKQELNNQTCDAKSLKNKLIDCYQQLKAEQEQLKAIEQAICEITGELHISSSDEDEQQGLQSSDSSATNGMALANGMMSQSLFGSAELLCPKRSQTDLMSKSINENMFYNNKIEHPSNMAPATSTPKRPTLQVVHIDEEPASAANAAEPQTSAVLRIKQVAIQSEEAAPADDQNERLKFNLSLGSDDFEVNPLERRVPSQDDIDRICKVTLDAPISTKGASTKIFDSIKEIERNRQLLLAQQGHHVIEHERQKMQDLKKKCHDEARAQYLSMVSNSNDGSCSGADSRSSASSTSSPTLKPLHSTANTLEQQKQMQEMQQLQPNADKENKEQQQCVKAMANSTTAPPLPNKAPADAMQQRRSHPEFGNTAQYDDIEEAQQHEQLLLNTRRNSRPLSEANSDYSCDPLSDGHGSPTQMSPSTASAYKASLDISLATSGIGSSADMERQRYSSDGNSQDDKRASMNSNETTSAASGTGSNSERKRALPKHQRPLTRYLPIFSPDLNLRHHIETAGHQIALCPHVFVDAYSCRGYLHKLGATFHGWARRWFVLDRQRSAFIYYADKSERKPRGGAYFSTIDEVYLDHLNASKSGRPHSTFIVKTKKRSYHLQAASDAAARIWIDAIITGAQGNLDY